MQVIKVDTRDAAFPLYIEQEIRLHCPCILTECRMVLELQKKIGGRMGTIARFSDLPKGNFGDDGGFIHRPLLEAFCDKWRADDEVTFTITMIATGQQDETGYSPRWVYRVERHTVM